jgi:EmrB/QacA subfamily drug resistance transporter
VRSEVDDGPVRGEAWRRRVVLGLVAAAQFMLVLDLTIVTVAFPTIERELGFAAERLQWLVTAYALTFGGFLLLGGRAGDVWGRRRVFIIGSLGFALASLAAGLAVNEIMLVAARAAEGLAAAFVSPAALSLLTTTFAEGAERNRALGIFGAVASSGAASGLILGGVISQWAGWRWVFLVNVPLAVAGAIVAVLVLEETRGAARRRLDGPGAFAVTAALLALIYGLDRGQTAGFDSASAIAILTGSLLFGLAFVLVEQRAADPLVPFRLLRLRTLAGTDSTSFSVSALVASTLFFLSLYMQQALELTPVRTGLAFLPMALTIMAVSALAARLAEPVGVKQLLFVGLSALIAAAVLLSRAAADGTYTRDVLPGMLLFSVGLGVSYTATTIGGTAGVPDEDQGVAGGLLDTFNQVGGAVGLAILAAIAATQGELTGADGAEGLVDGMRAAFLAGLGFAVFGIVTAAVLISEADCTRELRRRRAVEGPGLDTAVAGCLARLGGQVLDRPSTGATSAEPHPAHARR